MRGLCTMLLLLPCSPLKHGLPLPKAGLAASGVQRPFSSLAKAFPWRRRKHKLLSCRGTQEEQAGEAESSSDSFPERYKVAFMASLAFVICNMDKVNMSVAIIPMSQQFGWPATTGGLVQSSFFLGYAISQLPGGWLARQFTGKLVLRGGVFLWSLATALVPVSASWLPGIFASRILVGLGEGVSPSAATDIVARNFSASERSRAVSFIFGGLSVGSIAGLLLAPVCIQNYGWESVFYIFGVVGILWCLGFNFKDDDDDKQAPSQDASSKLPWRAFLRSPAVWAMIYAHFCGNWGYFNLLSWLPTYASAQLHYDLTNAALVSIFPPLASVPVAAFSSLFADKLIASGVDTTFVRKLCQSIAFIAPSASMTIVAFNPEFPPWLLIIILGSGIALGSFSLSGLYCTHQDISPRYASILLGITNTAGAVPGLLGIALTGYLYDVTNTWNLALFGPSIFFYLSGAVVWNAFASSKAQTFEEGS